MAASRVAISSGGRTRSIAPLAIALCGMPACWADCSSWANVRPPAALISEMPSVPSDPVPERITPIADGPCTAASDRRKWSTG